MTLAPLLQASLAIQIHTLSAILAFVLGALVLFRRKGDVLHRLGGRVWASLMLLVCVSSMFIHAIQVVGIWSPIHLLSVGTTWFLYKGIVAARARRIHEHRTTMKGLYLGALIIAGFFTFMPGRIMYTVFFGGPNPWVGVAAAAAIVAVVCALAAKMALETFEARGRATAR